MQATSLTGLSPFADMLKHGSTRLVWLLCSLPQSPSRRQTDALQAHSRCLWILCREGVVRGGVMGQGLRGLVGGVTAGVTGVVRAPLQGYSDGTGLIAGTLLILTAQTKAC